MLAFAHFYARRASRWHLSFGIVAVVPIPTDLRQGATDPHGYAVQGTSHPVISESVVQATLVSDEPQVTISTFLAKAWGSLPSWRVVTGDPLLPQHGWVRCLGGSLSHETVCPYRVLVPELVGSDHVGNLLRGRIVVPTMSTSSSCSDGLGTVTY